jgi:hypothetical protein
VQKDFKKIIRRFFIWQAIVRGQSVSTEGPFLIKGTPVKAQKIRVKNPDQHFKSAHGRQSLEAIN